MRAPFRPRGAWRNIAVVEFDPCAQRLKRLEMQIHRAGADGAAAGQRNLGLPARATSGPRT